MTQYTIKRLDWVDKGLYVFNYVAENEFFKFKAKSHSLDEFNFNKSILRYENKTSGESRLVEFIDGGISAAKDRAQEIWNDYLKQYLEEIK